jgi:hypothetical protein
LSADTLSREPAGYIDANGDEHEYERPITYPLDDGSNDEIAWLNDSAWSDIVSARQPTSFDRPRGALLVLPTLKRYSA